ncbi:MULTISPECIES: hypothetical protein [Actinomadura]|uniref:Uncharacterized protein n=1 Tax=Actinomadura madurae TaxID=1993 RepID=A0A1I4Z4M8_9ACTN|nr:hypothetical protein [Actinomadura madurae]SFN45225.1 hypothetical protein SAMN04489713_10249 [Actinomadura madurae]SPT49680.1 Uncharacterised protein [Actinomadura madurae]
MPDSPFGRYSGDLPGRHAGRPVPRPLERSFRCPSTVRRRPPEAPARRYEDFVALHEEMSADARRPFRALWWAGISAALAGAGLAFVAVVALRAMFGVEVPVFAGDSAGTAPAATSYALCAMAATVQATALMHLLLSSAARPVRAFAWIGGFAVVLLTVLPLVLRGPFDAALATSAVNLAGGTAVVVLLSAVVACSRRSPWEGPPGRFRR